MCITTVQHDYFVAISFQSDKHYTSPFFDIELDVTFTNPNNDTITIPAYWNGQHEWIVRYSSRKAGKHTFISICSDITNKTLHQLSGEIEIHPPYSGGNSLLQHGAPIVSADRRHFCHEDGTPFFWLGDTWWMGLCKRLSWPQDFKTLAQDRQKKGFNVVQLVAGLYPDMPAFDPRGESESGFCWTQDFTQINPAFFDEADQRIEYLVSMGIVPCILGSWGYYLSLMGVEKMKLHWRYLIARWGALPVVWVAAGEQTMPWYLSKQKAADSTWLKEAWSEVMMYMREINAYRRMITTHPVKSARASVSAPSLIDFDMQQTGHHASTIQQAVQAQQGREIKPIMPVISGESRYEALAISPKVTDNDVRQAFWAHTISSGLAGHTYGANGIWQINRPSNPFGKSPKGHNWGTLTWEDAMTLPGAQQLALAKKLLNTMSWHQFEPMPINLNSYIKPNNRLHKALYKLRATLLTPLPTIVAAAQTATQSDAIYYTLAIRKFSVCSAKSITHATWLDPSNGAQYPAVPIQSNDQTSTFIPPQKNAAGDDDWLLLITSNSQSF